MAGKVGEYIWYDGNLIPWNNAKIHIMSHVIHYGSSVFEGIRAYNTPKGPAVFRLADHMNRLLDSAKIYRMDIKWNLDDLCKACIKTIKKNKLNDCYIRPIILRGFGEFGVSPFKNPLETYIATWEWGKYLGPEAIEQGVDVRISSWNRFAPNTSPTLSKSGSNYMNSQLIKMEANLDGYSEGIALDHNGYVSEGSGENIFVIRKGIIHTPPISSSILPGFTRDTVFRICEDLGFKVKEEVIPRELLYISDEIFLTGTAAELTPVRSVDKIQIGNGSRGKMTAQIQNEFFNIFTGERDTPEGWLTFIYS